MPMRQVHPESGKGVNPMPDSVLSAGDVIEATVTKSLPFGVLVQTADDVPGLVRGARADAGATIRVRVTMYDAELARFAADLA